MVYPRVSNVNIDEARREVRKMRYVLWTIAALAFIVPMSVIVAFNEYGTRNVLPLVEEAYIGKTLRVDMGRSASFETNLVYVDTIPPIVFADVALYGTLILTPPEPGLRFMSASIEHRQAGDSEMNDGMVTVNWQRQDGSGLSERFYWPLTAPSTSARYGWVQWIRMYPVDIRAETE